MNVNADDASLDLAEITGNAYRSRHDSIEDGAAGGNEYAPDDAAIAKNDYRPPHDSIGNEADGWSGNKGRSFIKF